MIISLILSKFQRNLKQNEYGVGASWYCYFENKNSRTFKWCIKVSLAEIF